VKIPQQSRMLSLSASALEPDFIFSPSLPLLFIFLQSHQSCGGGFEHVKAYKISVAENTFDVYLFQPQTFCARDFGTNKK